MDFIEYYIKRDVPVPLILKNIVENIDGAYNLILYYNDYVYIVRDSLGMRPLSIAMKSKMVCISSESSLYNEIDFTFHREVKPGEVIICKQNVLSERNSSIENNEYKMQTYGIFTYQNRSHQNLASCALEYVYLSNNNSIFNGILVKDARNNFGKQLWEEESEQFKQTVTKGNYIVSYVPNTALYAAEGYAKASTLQFKTILSVKKKGRTFIISNQKDGILKHQRDI